MTTAEQVAGAVVVPRSLASTTFNALVLYLDARVRTDGGEVTADARALLHALNRAVSTAPDASTSSEGSAVGGLEILGAHEVADILGCSRRWATALLGSGRLRAWQVGGRTWVTTRGDLDAYRYGRTEATDEQPQDTPEPGQAPGLDTAQGSAQA